MADTYSLKAILSAVDGISPVLKNMQGVAKNARKYLGDVGSSASKLGAQLGIPLGVVSAIGAGFGLVAIKKAVVDFAALGEEVQKGALKAGMNNAQYQRMNYVFQQAGLASDVLQGSMGKLNKNLGSAGSGKNKDLEGLLKTLGVPLRSVNGQVRTAVDMLPELAQAFIKNKDPVKQAAIGNALFGKSYADMLPLLNEGSEGIEKSLARFKMLKGVISDEDLAGAKEFGDQLQDLDFVTKGFQRTIAAELVPTLRPVIEQLIQWAAANKKVIATEVKKVVQGLVATLKQIDWAALVQGMKGLISTIGDLVDKVGGAKNALLLLAVFMNLQSIAAAVGLIGSLGRLAFALFGVGGAAMAATTKLAFFAASQATLTGALSTSLAGAAKSAGLVAAAGLIGYAIGSVIYSTLLEDTRVADWIGSIPTRIAAFFGSADAQKTLANNAAVERMFAPSIATTVAPTVSAAAQVARSAPSIAPTVAAAADYARLPAPAKTPGGLGSGAFNLNAPATANLTGSVLVDFRNAPPGMQVPQAKANGSRVAINTNVGYRTVGTEGAF